MSAVHFLHDGILFLLLIYGTIAIIKPVAGSSLALCEGGQTCLPPKECCAQGCCYLYAPPGAPRVPLANNEHMLSMLFLNHWYFWCFVLAVVLALLCTCSLWKKRRQLCGWDTSARHSQSEGDSAGSCYAPPQYSRCNSFHIHAPPPYTEVASKPDLYPLVFSYTDPGKGNGANYLMVQYFRNYIVQPVGSISGTSTVDSLSSSFICNANEANTLVPPPYSRAASPDQTMSFRNYLMPRSASQQVCLTAAYADRPAAAALGSLHGSRSHHAAGYHRDDESLLEQTCMLPREQQQQQQQQDEVHGAGTNPTNTTINRTDFSSTNVSLMECPSARNGTYHHPLVNFMDHGPGSRLAGQAGGPSSRTGPGTPVPAGPTEAPRMAHSSESFRSPPSDSPGSPVGDDGAGHQASHRSAVRCLDEATGHEHCDPGHGTSGGVRHGGGGICKLCCSTGDISVGAGARTQHRKDRAALHKSLETCCHVNLHGTTPGQPPGSRLANLAADSDDSLLNAEVTARKGAGCARSSCAVSSAGSNVSSLVNLDPASSPPRATSPTAEVRELLEQIRQLHTHGGDRGTTDGGGSPPPLKLTPPHRSQAPSGNLPAYRRPSSLIGRRGKLFSKPSSQQQQQQQQQHQQHYQRHQHSQQTGSSSSSSKAMYIPISFTQNCMVLSAGGRHPRSPATGGSGSGPSAGFLNRGRSRYCWMSKSAPTTPGAAPGSFAGGGGTLGDNRPLLLHEQEEDGEQNV